VRSLDPSAGPPRLCRTSCAASTRTYHLNYKASTAQWHAERRARRPKVAKLVSNERLRDDVQDRLSGAIRATMAKPWGRQGHSARAGASRTVMTAGGCRHGAPSR
jgi:hypothetical protein